MLGKNGMLMIFHKFSFACALQIFTNKATSRKWTDDSEVTNCNACDKGFSVTVRKVFVHLHIREFCMSS